MKDKKMKNIFAAIALLLALTIVAMSQNQTGVSGHVTDAHNANVARAEVRLTSRTGQHLFALTDGNGAYAFKSVPAGDYVLQVKSPGFASFADALVVKRGESLTKDVQLSIEAVNETVLVTATGTAQRADEASKAVTVLDNQSIEAKREISPSGSLRGGP